MRQIKFRGWYKNWGAYNTDYTKIHTGSEEMNNDIQNTHDNWGDKIPAMSFGSILTDPDWTVEQFTGLHDTTGKEIYEGDILLAGDYKKIVVFDETRAAFMMYNDRDFVYKDEWDILQPLYKEWIDTVGAVVIGNIHEGEK